MGMMMEIMGLLALCGLCPKRAAGDDGSAESRMPAFLQRYHAASRKRRQPAALLSSRQSFLWKKSLTPCAAYARRLLTHRMCCGEVAQLGEHRLRKAGVEGSNPFFSTTNFQRVRKANACGPFSIAATSGGTSLPRSAGNNVFNPRKRIFPLP